jgi:predicted RND superfamily exporter protein
MAVTFKKEYLNSARRAGMVSEIKALGEQFEKDQGVDVYFSGMPYVRSEYMKIVSEEMKLFLILAVLVTSVILFLFFKSFSIVFFTMLIVGIEVVWSIGLIELFGYKISILSGLVAPIIIVIGIPNCVFLINKYQIYIE